MCNPGDAKKKIPLALEYVWNVIGFDLNVSVFVLIVIETFGMNLNVLDFMSRKLYFFYYLYLA